MKIDLANIDSIDFEGVILYLKFVDEFLSFIKYYNKKLTSILYYHLYFIINIKERKLLYL